MIILEASVCFEDGHYEMTLRGWSLYEMTLRGQSSIYMNMFFHHLMVRYVEYLVNHKVPCLELTVYFRMNMIQIPNGDL